MAAPAARREIIDELPADRSRRYRRGLLRAWAVRHARLLERVYGLFARGLTACRPVFSRLGWQRVEAPVAVVERAGKGLVFGCRMCGACILSSTGMSCPMNCPKSMRNGPCGGVRADGACEVDPAMRCVWVAAWDGAQAMQEGAAIHTHQPPLDHRRSGRSSWLAVARGNDAGAGRHGGGL